MWECGAFQTTLSSANVIKCLLLDRLGVELGVGLPGGGAYPGAELTRVQVLVLLGEVLALVHPLAVALEEDLQGRSGSAAQLDRGAPDDVGIGRLLQEVRQGSLHWRQGVWLDVTACGTHTHTHTASLYVCLLTGGKDGSGGKQERSIKSESECESVNQ